MPTLAAGSTLLGLVPIAILGVLIVVIVRATRRR